ncbi:MAG: hypothetical protein HRT52_13530 [Colwellia sp.]|nr:hypothetical protein [Colwellia sp.]
MDLLTLNRNSGKLIYREKIDDTYLEVREFDNFRWFHFGDDAIQSIIDVTQPTKLLSPIPQAMLSFLLWKNTPLTLLNLGVGGGCFERYFQFISDITLKSVEISTQVIDVAKNYLYLPKDHLIHIESAEVYLQNSQQKVEVILCDIFANKDNPACLHDQDFYHNLQKNCTSSGLVFINLFPINEQNIVAIITLIKPYFDHVALIEFENYKNVVLVLSQQVLPDKSMLLEKNNQENNVAGIDFLSVIARWHNMT